MHQHFSAVTFTMHCRETPSPMSHPLSPNNDETSPGSSNTPFSPSPSPYSPSPSPPPRGASDAVNATTSDGRRLSFPQLPAIAPKPAALRSADQTEAEAVDDESDCYDDDFESYSDDGFEEYDPQVRQTQQG